MDLIHSILIVHSLYCLTATSAGFGSYYFMVDVPTSAKISVLCGAILSLVFEVRQFTLWISCQLLTLCYQCYYASRIKVISQRWALPLAYWFVATARFALNLAVVILASKSTLSEFLLAHKKIALVPLTSGIVLDFSIAINLLYWLVRKQAGFSRSAFEYE